MADDFPKFVDFCLIFLTGFLSFACGEQCIKDTKSFCACSSSKGKIDLLPLASKDTRARFFHISASDGKLYSYNPCIVFSEGKPTDCNNVFGCQIIPGGVFSYYPIADSKKDWTVTGSFETKDLTFHYSATKDDQPRNMEILLTCSNEDGRLIAQGETGQKNLYTFTLMSRYACYSGVYPYQQTSIGTVLVIIFFVCLVVYIIGGFLFLTYVRHHTGWERFPNQEFWSDFPHLVKDGACFVFRGCKSDTSYEQI